MSKGLIIFLEGDTEEQLYKKFISMLHSLVPGEKFRVDKIFIRNLKGIGNFKNRAVRVFCKDIKKKCPMDDYTIALCYDTDVFELSAKPPVNWKEVDMALKEAGARRILHIKAKHSIEDWILKDINGLCGYLHLSVVTQLSGTNGLEKIQSLFKKANKVYAKGANIKGFVDCLDTQMIMCASCNELKGLCKELGVKCRKLK